MTELVQILNLIKSKKHHIRNSLSKKQNLDIESVNMINKFITDEINYETNIISFFSRIPYHDHIKIKVHLNSLIREIIKKKEYDIIFISHLTNKKRLEEDFDEYFGNTTSCEHWPTKYFLKL